MSEYQTPRELQAQTEQEDRVRKVLDQAVADGVSCKLAMHFGEAEDVVYNWVDRTWNGLRDNLQDDQPDRAGIRIEDRLAAIIMLLDERINDEFYAVLRSVRDVS